MRRQSSILLATLLLALVFPAHADDAAVRKELEADYAKCIAGMKKKDIKPFLNLATSDFTMTQNGQTMNRQNAEAALQKQFAMTTSVDKMTIKIQSLKVSGNTAVVNTQSDVAFTMNGQDKKPHKFTDSEADKDTWVKTPKGWRLKSEETLNAKITLDGKPFNPATDAPKQ